MQNLEQEQQDAFNAMKKMAEKLSQVRQRSAKKFAEEICGQMKELNFLDSRFEIRISEAEKYSSNGKDEAEFYLSVNPGEPLKPLGSVASGGEISRVMLAVKTVLADEEDTYFMNAADYAKASDIDGIHMVPEEHKKLANAFADKIKEILS